MYLLTFVVVVAYLAVLSAVIYLFFPFGLNYKTCAFHSGLLFMTVVIYLHVQAGLSVPNVSVVTGTWIMNYESYTRSVALKTP